MSLRLLSSHWLAVWFVLAVSAGWLASPPFLSSRAPRRSSVSLPAPATALQQNSRPGLPALAPELVGLTPSDQLAVIAAMAEAAADAPELTRLLEMIKSLPLTIELEARQLVALRWLDFDPAKACEFASYSGGVLNCWAARDPMAVIEFARKPDYDFSTEAWQAGMKHLVKKDPQAAWRLYAEAPEGWNDDDEVVDVTAAIAALNPAEFAARLPREGMPGHRYFPDVGAAKAWLLHDPVPGFSWIAHNPCLDQGHDLIYMFQKVPMAAWPEALKALHEVDAPRRDRLVFLIGVSLDNEHPRELIEMMDAAGIDQNVGRDGSWRVGALGLLAQKDPDTAAAMLSGVPPDLQPDAARSIAQEWHRQSPEEARAWVADMAEGDTKAAALKTIEFLERPKTAESAAQTEEQKLLFQWNSSSQGSPVPRDVLDDPGLLDRLAAAVSRLEDPAQRGNYSRTILNTLMQGDSQMILRGLRSFPETWPEGAKHFFWSWHQLHPDAARSAAESLPEPIRHLAVYALDHQ